MRRLREWIVRLWASVRPGRSDAEIREELRLHLELAIEHENGRGRDVENARRAALARVGPAAHAVNAMHDQRGWLAETLTLAFIGGALGLVLAYWGKALLGASAFATQDVDLRINAPVFGVTMMISLVAGFLCGFGPAVRATHRRYVHPAGALELRGGRSSIFSRSLLVMQVATSIVILAIAGLLARTLGNWHRIEPGFDTDNLLVFSRSARSVSAISRRRVPFCANASSPGSARSLELPGPQHRDVLEGRRGRQYPRRRQMETSGRTLASCSARFLRYCGPPGAVGPGVPA